MFKMFAILIRILSLGFFALFMVSIVASVLGTANESAPARWVGQWESVGFPGVENPMSCAETLTLINAETGQTEGFALPDTDRWGLLGLSPWVHGERREAVGHCHERVASADGKTFWGLARINLSNGEILEKAELGLPPTSRPCWLPLVPDAVLFTAGDGQLHRYRFRGAGDIFNLEEPSFEIVRGADSIIGKRFHLNDPSWMTDPRSRQILLVSAIDQSSSDGQRKRPRSQIWWLELSWDGLAIQNAGKLFEDSEINSTSPVQPKRFPRLVVDSAGKGKLYFLGRTPKEGSMQLESVAVRLDTGTGRPSLDSDAHVQVIADDCAPVPFIVSANGTTIYRISARTHEIVKEQTRPFVALR